MNKDVIYIEPEDDITDIITKIEKAKNKIVALVPPKKAGVLRSIVNIKLIAKAGATAEKTVVIVTTDPSITKLAAATKLPVTESLQSAPTVPVLADDEPAEEAAEPETPEKEENSEEEKEDETSEEANENSAEDAEDEDENNEEADDAKKAEKPQKSPKKSLKDRGDSNSVIGWIKDHKVVLGVAGGFSVLLLIFLIWAFGVAPAVDISVTIKTEQKRFSENVTFTTTPSEEDASIGKFYAEQKKLEDVREVTFEATGKKNIGEKATGDVVVYAFFKEKGTVPIKQGETFTINNLSFTSDEAASISWDGKAKCDNASDQASLINSGCMISARVKVTATQSGEKYNIAASRTGWDTVVRVGVYSDSNMEGGTDKFITVVQQSDVEKAKESITVESESINKAKLFNTVEDDKLIIEGSFKQDTADAVSTPKVDEEVKEGETPTLKVTTTITVYVVDKVKLEQFIEAKSNLASDQKIYEIKDPYIENFVETDKERTGKLKAQYFIGPKITEGELVEKVLGKGIGDATREIRDIYGVSEVLITPSYPWVMSVPGDSNKVTITFETKDDPSANTKETTKESSED